MHDNHNCYYVPNLTYERVYASPWLILFFCIFRSVQQPTHGYAHSARFLRPRVSRYEQIKTEFRRFLNHTNPSPLVRAEEAVEIILHPNDLHDFIFGFFFLFVFKSTSLYFCKSFFLSHAFQPSVDRRMASEAFVFTALL